MQNFLSYSTAASCRWKLEENNEKKIQKRTLSLKIDSLKKIFLFLLEIKTAWKIFYVMRDKNRSGREVEDFKHV